MRTTTALLATLALAACAKPETADQMATRMSTESAAAKTAIDAQGASYQRYLNANQGDSLATLFAAGGMLMPPGAKAVAKDGIAAWMTASPMPPGGTVTLHSSLVVANGPLAVEHGVYAFNMPAQGRTPAVEVAGKYLNHWTKVGDQWLLMAQMWSDDVPPMAPPPPARH